MSTAMRCKLLAATTLAALPFALPAHGEVFLDFGVAVSEVEAKSTDGAAEADGTHSGLHLGVGVRRSSGERGDIGVRLELDTVDSQLMLAVRALDYRRHLSERVALGFYLGAARLDLATPAYGYYLGTGVVIKEALPRFDLGIDLRLGDNLARDHVLPSDPAAGSPDSFYDVTSLSLSLSHRF